MRRLPTIVLFCVSVTAIAMVRSASADNSMSSGSTAGMPKSHQFLLGNWQCTVNLAATQGQPATTDHGAMSIAASPSMTLHSHIVAKDYMSDSYQGYNAKTKTHWLNSVDTQGVVTAETSTDGVVFTGTSWWPGGTSSPTRDTQTKIRDTKIRDVTDVKENGKWAQLADAICTKS